MKKFAEIKSHRINGKMIYILDNHKYALIPWSKIKRKSKKEVMLVSLTNQTEIQNPFASLRSSEEVEHMLSHVDGNDDISLYSLINELDDADYLKTALYKNIINKAFIISMSCRADYPKSDQERAIEERIRNKDINFIKKIIEGQMPVCPKMERTFPKSDIYMPCFIPEDRIIDTDKYDDYVIEDVFLKDKFEVLSRMCPEVISSSGEINGRYILDIDLDYFHSSNSLKPESCRLFNDLVKNAGIITISHQKTCDDKLQSDVVKSIVDILNDVVDR